MSRFWRFAILGLAFLPVWGRMAFVSAQPPQVGQADKLPGDPPPANNVPSFNMPVPLVNSTRVFLKCAADQFGAEGLARVDLWVTSDAGKTWKKLPECVLHKEELETVLPGEGVFGLTPVVVGSNGMAGSPPLAGQAPAFWLEVDTIGPTVQLHQIKPEGSVVNLAWQAQDRNLGPGPIALFYRTLPSSPWTLIADNLSSQGSYRWKFPWNQGRSFYLRLCCTDRAGNKASTETTNPLTVDVQEPKLVILGATSRTSARPEANGPPLGLGKVRVETAVPKAPEGFVVPLNGEAPLPPGPRAEPQGGPPSVPVRTVDEQEMKTMQNSSTPIPSQRLTSGQSEGQIIVPEGSDLLASPDGWQYSGQTPSTTGRKRGWLGWPRRLFSSSADGN